MDQDYKISAHSISIVDDDSDILFFLKSVLSEYTSVSLFESPVSALEEVKQSNYDILITDLQMPKMDGFELIREVRKINRDIRIIIISGVYGEKKLASFIDEYQVSAFLEKPFERKDLLKAMEDQEEPL